MDLILMQPGNSATRKYSALPTGGLHAHQYFLVCLFNLDGQ